ncbi:MAG: hypothetical protein SFV23_00010 [Planctomycetaceae bacterium]|nr:hypothetical protein [Planctomycetaceae bacterium]
MRCASNLRQIGQASELYCNENRGQFPPTLSLLFSTQDLYADQSTCPLTNTPLPSTHPSAALLDTSSDFVYLGSGLTSKAPSDVIIAHDRPTNHPDGTVNVVYLDSRVERFPARNFPAALSKSATIRAQWEATTRPAAP